MGRWVLLLLCMALGACATAPPFKAPQDLPSSALLEVPFFPQQAYFCGPAALAEVARYRGVDIDQQQLAAKTFIPDRKGSLAIEMHAAARQLGLLPYPLASDFPSLLRELAAGNPVLVLQNLGLSWLPQWHYALAVGYRLSDKTLILHSGKRPNYELGFATFLNTWRRADAWARVVVDPGVMPQSADPLTYLQTAYAFEETDRPELARDFYQAAVSRWPEHPAALTAAANAALKSAESGAARELFERALAKAPDSPALWNNYAYALKAQGCDRAAGKAINVALQLAPEDPRYRRSAEDFAPASGLDGAHCPRLSGDNAAVR